MADPPGRPSLAEDWVAICQSELSAWAADRERAEAWSAGLLLWGELARAVAGRGRRDGPAGPAAEPPPAGAAPAADAPDARDRAIARLAARVVELERRLQATAPR